jgi:hypothetical protein
MFPLAVDPFWAVAPFSMAGSLEIHREYDPFRIHVITQVDRDTDIEIWPYFNALHGCLLKMLRESSDILLIYSPSKPWKRINEES